MKKIIALVLALAMILMVGAVFADEPATEPAPLTNTATLPKADISISNMEKDDSVALYKIVEWDKTAADWKLLVTLPEAYDTVEELVEALNGSDASNAATALAAAVASASQVTGHPVTVGDSKIYTSNQEVGMYLALVTTSTANIYNPMVLSVNFTSPETAEGGAIAATDPTGTTIVAKKQPVTLTKEVDTEKEGYYDVTSPADQKKGVAVGDTVPFIVNTQTPNYGENYTSPKFVIKDTLSEGLEMNTDQQAGIVVMNGETILSAKENADDTEYDYEIATTKSGYTITFSTAYLHTVKANTNVTVKYSATVTNKAKEKLDNVEEYVNDVELVFSNSPSTENDSLHDDTKHYTFSIDANLLKKEGGKESTKELVKIGVDESTGEVITSWKTSDETTWKTISPLAGAVFTLTRSDGEKEYTATSDDNGYLYFPGLDAATYSLAETSAPAGYKFSTAAVPVVISAEYNDDDTLKKYTITVNGSNSTTYTAINEGQYTVETTINEDADTTGFINEKGVTLPSTGGIGTTIFYILGGLLVVGAAVILVARRKAQD